MQTLVEIVHPEDDPDDYIRMGIGQLEAELHANSANGDPRPRQGDRRVIDVGRTTLGLVEAGGIRAANFAPYTGRLSMQRETPPMFGANEAIPDELLTQVDRLVNARLTVAAAYDPTSS